MFLRTHCFYQHVKTITVFLKICCAAQLPVNTFLKDTTAKVFMKYRKWSYHKLKDIIYTREILLQVYDILFTSIINAHEILVYEYKYMDLHFLTFYTFFIHYICFSLFVTFKDQIIFISSDNWFLIWQILEHYFLATVLQLLYILMNIDV